MHKWIFTSLLLAGAVNGQTIKTEWNGHKYEVVWFKDATGIEPVSDLDGWWLSHQPREHAATIGGHVVTITSAQEEDAIRAMWAEIPLPGPFTLTANNQVDVSAQPWVVTWETGEVSTHVPPTLDEEHTLRPYFALLGKPMFFGGAEDQSIRDALLFYILEIDPPHVDPKDSDGDGLTNDEEINTRHHYEFVQAPEPVTITSGGVDPRGFEIIFWHGGWTREQCAADAASKGGHILKVDDFDEWVAVNHMGPWPVGPASTYNNDVPIIETPFRAGNLIRGGGGSGPHITGTSNSEPVFSTYIVEFENSTDPNNPDTDNDGLTDGEEVLTYHTDPLIQDTDRDGLGDGGEVKFSKTNPLVADTDGDGLSDFDEVATHHTNPLLADSDSDGFPDGLEIAKGTNPLDSQSLPVVQLEVFPAIEVVFPTKAGETYQLQTSGKLGPWLPLGEVFIGDGQPYSRFIQAREQASFLRAVIVR